MKNFESAYKEVCKLTEDFKKNESSFLSPSYMEAEVRRDFIDKFFEALGWDVYHKQQKNPYEQEVKVEKGVSVGRAQKRADYAFFISPDFRSPKFFAEAKKPSRNLKNADDYFQTIRYGWNANTPVAVLTDFQELHILDCRIKPNINTVLENPAHKSYCFEDYIDLEKFAEIFYLLSRDAVADGSLEKYSASLAKPKGKIKAGTKAVQAIDEDFLEYIDGIRERLAKAFKKNDESLSSEELTEATQKTIDRLVFIRFLEDKLIEPQNIISEFGRRGDTFKDFISASGSLDSKYNGIVFKEHFIDKKDFKGPNETEFKKICEEFSHLNSPYDFNAIPVHIIGSIYERFLGKVVNATAHRVKVEEKPEVRKAGGVYYTPKYIVDYIVENTVGKIIDGKTPAEISKLRFADIACGSGSFLIGVFETLLKYHTEYYNQNPEQARKDGCIEKDSVFVLSIKQKQKILQNNIYGVDIDLQAVEVTQLSLALKMLEDETTATANEMQVLFHEKILPDLSKNIVCGNSLIGTDILEGKMFGTDEERKLNPMDFETTFPNVFKSGGFDAVVGNPPYLAFHIGDKNEKEYYIKNYKCARGKYDQYVIFSEKALRILNKNGFFGYIIPNKFILSNYGANLKELFLKNRIIEILDFKDLQIFKGATNYPCIIIIKKENGIFNFEYKTVTYFLDSKFTTDTIKINQSSLDKSIWLLVDKSHNRLIDKLKKNNITLDSISDSITQGIRTGSLNIYHHNINEELIHNLKLENNLIIKIYNGKNIKRYFSTLSNKDLLIFPYEQDKISPANLNLYPNIKCYLENYKTHLLERKDSGKIFKHTEKKWFEYWDSKPTCFKMPKIVFPDISNMNNFMIDLDGIGYLNTCYAIFLKDNKDILFILGLLNSKLLEYFVKKICPSVRGGYFRYKTNYIKNIPIPNHIRFDYIKKQAHDKIVTLVEQMLEAKKQLHGSKTEKDKIYFERKCESLDKQIDAEVYKLYGLTKDEIKIVEGI